MSELVDKMLGLPSIEACQLEYRGYKIRWTGFNQDVGHRNVTATNGEEIFASSKAGQFLAHIMDRTGRFRCSYGFFSSCSSPETDTDCDQRQRMKLAAAKLIRIMDAELDKPESERQGWCDAEIAATCHIEEHNHALAGGDR